MNPTPSRPTPLVRLLLALSLLLGLLPAVALAATHAPTVAQETPAAEAEAPQVFVSELLPAASSPGRLITLTLDPDATATLSSNYLNGEAPIVEVGTWATDESGALLVSLSGTADVDYDAPVEFTFAQAEDGSLTATSWDESRYGSEGLALAPAQNLEIAGAYVSDTLPAASSPGREITLELAPDGTAALSTDFLNDEEPIVEIGSWSADAETGEVSVSLTGRADSVYEAPIEWTFAMGEEGGLTATAWDETLFGSEGLSLARAAEEEVGPADGVWVSNILPAASSPGQVVLLILYPDGSLQSSTWYLNNELPIIEEGSWVDGGDGAVTVTITGSTEREYETAQELVFAYDGETLTYLSLVLNRLQEEGASGNAEAVAFYTSDVLPAASSPGLQRSLIFYDDGSVQMVSDYLNGEEPVIELGTWTQNEDDTLRVELTGTAETDYSEPLALTFALADGALTATEWDTSIFGADGLTFAEQSLDDLLLEDEEPLSSEPTADATPVLTTTLPATAPEPITVTVTVTEPEAVAPSEATTATTESGDDPLAGAAPFETPEGAQAVFVSDVLPAASSPGRLLRLVLFADGSLQLISDYLNGEAPILEVGTWEESAAAEVVVTLTGQIASPYAEPRVITFAEADGTLTAVEWDEATYGSEPLSLTLDAGE